MALFLYNCAKADLLSDNYVYNNQLSNYFNYYIFELSEFFRHKVVATGDGGGVVKVHRLSSELSHQIAGENESLNQLATDSIDNYL